MPLLKFGGMGLAPAPHHAMRAATEPLPHHASSGAPRPTAGAGCLQVLPGMMGAAHSGQAESICTQYTKGPDLHCGDQAL